MLYLVYKYLNKIIVSLLFIIIIVLFYLLKRKLNYWKIKGVPYSKPSFVFGNYKEYILLKKFLGDAVRDICKEFPNEPYIGSYFGTEPALVVQDPELIKLILTKKFYNCNGREITKYNDREPLNKMLFFAGGDLWKVLRQNLSPLFSTSKLKSTFHLIQNCNDTLEGMLRRELLISSKLDARNIASRYVMDCMGSCLFGVDTNTMENDLDLNPFAAAAHTIFSTSVSDRRKAIFRTMWPSIFYGLGFRLFNSEICKFFYELFSAVFKSRDNKLTSKQDFIDHMLDWKSKKVLVGSNLKTNVETEKTNTLTVDDELILAQCAQFFGAGFETSTGVLSFCLYELSKNRDAQVKLIAEIDEYLEKNKRKINYNCINDLPYLNACLDETMRLYPVNGAIAREVMESFTLPTGLKVDKGIRVHIPVYHLHRDPKYFSQPDIFSPERFLGDEKKKVIPYTFLPFGEGPRICVGMRLAKMVMIPALLTILKDFEVELAEGTPGALSLLRGALITQPTGDVRLTFVNRSK